MRRDAEENREKILAAARKLFVDRGLGVSYHQIAHTAGVAVGTVYRRFPDKADLVNALFASQVDVVVAHARAALLIDDPWASITDFLGAVLAMQADSRGLRELSSGSPHGKKLAEYARSHIAPVVAELVARGHAAGVLRPDVFEQDLALIPIMVGSIIHASRNTDAQLWKRALAMVLAGIGGPGFGGLPGATPTSEQVSNILNAFPDDGSD